MKVYLYTYSGVGRTRANVAVIIKRVLTLLETGYKKIVVECGSINILLNNLMLVVDYGYINIPYTGIQNYVKFLFVPV